MEISGGIVKGSYLATCWKATGNLMSVLADSLHTDEQSIL